MYSTGTPYQDLIQQILYLSISTSIEPDSERPLVPGLRLDRDAVTVEMFNGQFQIQDTIRGSRKRKYGREKT